MLLAIMYGSRGIPNPVFGAGIEYVIFWRGAKDRALIGQPSMFKSFWIHLLE